MGIQSFSKIMPTVQLLKNLTTFNVHLNRHLKKKKLLHTYSPMTKPSVQHKDYTICSGSWRKYQRNPGTPEQL